MSDKFYNVEIRKNIKTGKTDVFKIITYKNLTETEADDIIKEFHYGKSRVVKTNKSILDFMSEIYQDDPKTMIDEPINNVYQEYIEYCNDVGIEPTNNIIFSKTICNLYGLTSKVKYFKADGYVYKKPVTKRVYVKI